MKKLLSITLILLLVLSFAACSSTGSSKQTSAEVESQGQDLAEKIISDSIKQDGLTDLNIAGKKWPDNEFTSLIPEPKSGTLGTSMRDGDVYVILVTWTVEEVKAYAEQLKAAGFTYDNKVLDVGDYFFTCFNEDGVEVKAGSLNGIIITLP